MKNLTLLLLILLSGIYANAQVVSDRLGFMSSTAIVPDNGLQIEAGYLHNETNYSLLGLSSAASIKLRQSVKDKYEVQLSLPQYDTESQNPSFGLSTLMVKIPFARLAKVQTSVIGGVGVDFTEWGTILYMGMSIPMQYEMKHNNRLRAETSFSLLQYSEPLVSGFKSLLLADESAGISIAYQQDLGEMSKLDIGLNSRFLLAQRKEFDKERIFYEVLYGTLATQINITKTIALDGGLHIPLAIGKDQPAVGNGLIIKGGVSVLLAHAPLKKTKLDIKPEVY
jgi:hypothetical protein